MPSFLAAPGRLPDQCRVYAVGDVHGCADKLRQMHAAIAADLAARPVARATLVHLGDYIDRGPDSAAVLDLVRAPGLPVAETVNLCGNHEQMLLAALDAGDAGSCAHWRANGGDATLASWALSPRAGPSGWREGIPTPHMALLRGLSLTHRAGDYLFVHAGLRPGVTLSAQNPMDLMWIREPFLSWTGTLPAVVVHGHTPTAAPVLRRNRIGVDTGAVKGGALTCVVLEDDRLALLST